MSKGSKAEAMSAEEQWYSTAQVADQLGVNRDTVNRWIRDGQLAAIKLGGSTGYRISQTAITDFTSRRTLREALSRQLAQAV